MMALFALLLVFAAMTSAFHISSRVRNTFSILAKPAPAADGEKKKEGGLTIAKLVQLIGMGAGAPMLGEFKGVDERGALQFELEANNYNKELESRNFMDGEVDKFGGLEPPGFFANLMSGNTDRSFGHLYLSSSCCQRTHFVHPPNCPFLHPSITFSYSVVS